jgi:hypothetical protein
LEDKLIRTFHKAALLKIVSWLVLSPPLAMAADNLHVTDMPQLSVLYNRAAATFLSDNQHQEFSFSIDRDGTVSSIQTDHDWNQNTITVSGDTVATVHTHPRGTSPKPSPHDQDVATNTGMDVYVLSVHDLYVAHPYGHQPEHIGGVEVRHGKVVVQF